MIGRRLFPCLLFTALAASAQAPEFLVETADGSILAGTFAADFELVLVSDGVETRVPVRSVRRFAVSNVGEKEAAELVETARKIGESWRSDDYKVREAATQEALKLPGAAAPAFARLAEDEDPEVSVRAKEVLEGWRARKMLYDPRDLVALETRVLRGRLRFEELDLSTSSQSVQIARASVRTVSRKDVPVDAAASKPGEWPPPPATAEAVAEREGFVRAVVYLKGGTRLVGEGPEASFEFSDKAGKPFIPADLLEAVKDGREPGAFRVLPRGGFSVPATLVPKHVDFTAAGSRWSIPADQVESVAFGPLRSDAGTLAELVQEFQKAAAAGAEAPVGKFWVHIRDQRANPWDSAEDKAMTWSVLKVEGDACLVGARPDTDAYNGDTSTDEELPILAIRRSGLDPPEALDVSDPYSGWSGGELKLTRPVRGTQLDSLEAANRLVEEEFGKGWRMAQFHDTSTLGWHWWGYWVEKSKAGRPK